MPTGRVARIVAAMAQWLQQLGGRFLVFDWPDGSGKTTQAERLAPWLAGRGGCCLSTPGPGGAAAVHRACWEILGAAVGR